MRVARKLVSNGDLLPPVAHITIGQPHTAPLPMMFSSAHLGPYLLKPPRHFLNATVLIVVPIMVETVRYLRLDRPRWCHNDLHIRTPRLPAPPGVVAGIRVDDTDGDVAGRSNVVHLDRTRHAQRRSLSTRLRPTSGPRLHATYPGTTSPVSSSTGSTTSMVVRSVCTYAGCPLVSRICPSIISRPSPCWTVTFSRRSSGFLESAISLRVRSADRLEARAFHKAATAAIKLAAATTDVTITSATSPSVNLRPSRKTSCLLVRRQDIHRFG